MTCTNEQLEKIDNAMGALGGFVERMGGGLTAWWINIDPPEVKPQRYALVTFYEGDHEGDPDEPHWMVGLYDEDFSIGDAKEFHDDKTFAEAVSIVTGWADHARRERNGGVEQ